MPSSPSPVSMAIAAAASSSTSANKGGASSSTSMAQSRLGAHMPRAAAEEKLVTSLEESFKGFEGINTLREMSACLGHHVNIEHQQHFTSSLPSAIRHPYGKLPVWIMSRLSSKPCVMDSQRLSYREKKRQRKRSQERRARLSRLGEESLNVCWRLRKIGEQRTPLPLPLPLPRGDARLCFVADGTPQCRLVYALRYKRRRGPRGGEVQEEERYKRRRGPRGGEVQEEERSKRRRDTRGGEVQEEERSKRRRDTRGGEVQEEERYKRRRDTRGGEIQEEERSKRRRGPRGGEVQEEERSKRRRGPRGGEILEEEGGTTGVVDLERPV
ncbi:hypothetical protein EYF80_043279 [Liparis tanakae]|uniref:Uncharacterized protein n=1 Tax=Liparis tanakae TaxID=230148 RepID=A0A4Z2G092_9TELE|nr:hypothetical protein EYF80_043279 [Liparis tanakae]